jgi:uncharacterized protein (TIGR03437 family)
LKEVISLNRLKFIPSGIVLLWCVAAGIANAQTPANVTAIGGNGQVICNVCTAFPTMFAQVTDASGNPVPGAIVTWTVTAGLGQLGAGSQTVTDTTGVATNSYFGANLGLINLGPRPFFQNTIVASAGTGSATFYLTQQLPNPFNSSIASIQAYDASISPNFAPAQPLTTGTTLSGQVGASWNPPIKVVVVDSSQLPVPNVAVNIYNLQPATTGPALQCGGANAVNGTVLSDASGLAVCQPVFGGTPGNGQFDVLVGAVQSNAGDPNNVPQAVGGWVGLYLNVTPGAPAGFTLVSGNNQSAQAGTAFASPLVVKVLSSANTPLAGQTVTWSVSPAGAATLAGGASTTTDINGQTTNSVTLSAAASGTVTVTAKVANTSLPPLPFTLTAVPNVVVSSIQIVSGNSQAAIVGTQFGSPLKVQVSTNGSPAGIAVQFSVSPSGAATLSSNTATTASDGTAQVTATAGNTAGPVTVTATAGGSSVSFSLTISPPGPALTATSFYNGADLQPGAIAPCGVAAVIAPGVAPGVQNAILPSSIIGPPPTILGGTQVLVNNVASPLLAMGMNSTGQQQATFQVPCETTPGSSVPITVNVGAGTATVNAAVQTAAPGIFTTLLSDGFNHAVIVRPDGTFATIQNPARKGEQVVAFVTGLGPSSPMVGTGALPQPGVITTPQYSLLVGMAGGGVPLISTQLSPDRVGVWVLTFQIPTGIQTNASGLATFSISVVPSGATTPISSSTTNFPVQ